MMGYGVGMGWWGYALMMLSTVLFWGLVVAGVVALVRYVAPGGRAAPAPTGPRPQQVLAERFARGEIDEEEYRHRLAVLGS